MSEALADLSVHLRTHILLTGLVFLRVAAFMSLVPAIGERVIPMRIRLVLAVALAVTITPAVAIAVPATIGGPIPFLMFLAAETLNGLALGFALRLFTLAIEMAGTIAAQSSSLSQMFGGTGEPMPAISHLLMMAALCAVFAADLHIRLAQALILSYDALPPGRFPAAALMRAWQVRQVSDAFALAFGLAAPFLVTALIYNMALGVINRAMPSLMVSFLGAPALTGGFLVLLAIVAPLVIAIWLDSFGDALTDPFRMAP